MSQDEKKDKDESEEKPSETQTEKPNIGILSISDYYNSIETTMGLGQLASESIKKILDSYSSLNITAALESYRIMDDSIRSTITAMTDSIQLMMYKPNLASMVQGLAIDYSELMRDIPTEPNLFNEVVLVANIKPKMDGTMRAQNAYIEALERALDDKIAEINELKERLEEKKRKNEFAV